MANPLGSVAFVVRETLCVAPGHRQWTNAQAEEQSVRGTAWTAGVAGRSDKNC
jgi:hypothetical protein